MRIYAYLIAAFLIIAGVWYYGHTRYEAGTSKGVKEVAALKKANAAEAAKQAVAAQAKEAQQAANTAAAERQMLTDNDNANKKLIADIAALRSGNLRLQRRFQCPAVSIASAGAGEPNAPRATGFTEQDAETALGIASEGDTAIRQLHALQAVLTGERKP